MVFKNRLTLFVGRNDIGREIRQLSLHEVTSVLVDQLLELGLLVLGVPFRYVCYA